jgi:hypothetical protein
VRPVERDGAGHLQRRPPAVLAAWNERSGAVDDFSWAVTDELAARTGLTRQDLEDQRESRRDQLSGSGRALGGAWAPLAAGDRRDDVHD